MTTDSREFRVLTPKQSVIEAVSPVFVRASLEKRLLLKNVKRLAGKSSEYSCKVVDKGLSAAGDLFETMFHITPLCAGVKTLCAVINDYERMTRLPDFSRL